MSQGQHPRDYGDTFIMLEQMGHFLEREVEHAYQEFGKTTEHLTEKIESSLNIGNIIRRSSASWDGGYTICGILGHGDSFVFRDPWGIRPAFYYADDEIVIAASERPVIQTTLNITIESIHEINPGEALIIKKDGRIILEQIRRPEKVTPCSFERIYFSRGSDQDIYSERKKLGELLTPRILKSINNDLDNTVFSFIPNTAEVAFYGMFNGMQNYMIEEKKKFITENKDALSTDEIIRILKKRPRIEKVALKDIKLRTFIAQDSGRNDLAAHVTMLPTALLYKEKII